MELPKNIRETTKMYYDTLKWLKAEEEKRNIEELKRREESLSQKLKFALDLRKQKDLGNITEDDYLKIYKDIALTPVEDRYVQSQSAKQFQMKDEDLQSFKRIFNISYE